VAHAEKCPVCNGRGTVPPKDSITSGVEVPCYGCNGKGWVEVGNGSSSCPYEPYPYNPYPLYPWYPQVWWGQTTSGAGSNL